MVLTIKSFTKKYNNMCVIENINAHVPKGTIIGLIGDNGAGKTTLLKCIAGFIRNYQGDIETDTAIISSIEAPVFFDNLTIEKNLKFTQQLMNKSTDFSVHDALKFVRLSQHSNKKFRELSLGMKQKLIIARMLLSDSDVYLLDEPFNGLDVSTKKELVGILQHIKKQGKTIIISSHILDELGELSDSVWYLKGGSLIENIDLHSSERKYNILIKSKINQKKVSNKQLKTLGNEINMTFKKLNQTEDTLLLRANILQDDIFTDLSKLIAKKVEVLEYYDVTNKLDDYMIQSDKERKNYENLSRKFVPFAAK